MRWRNERQFLRMYTAASGPISQRWTDIGRSNWRELLPGLLPPKHTREKRCQANSRPANMLANPLESRIPSTAAGWSWWCGPALNPLNDVHFTKINPLDPGDHMLSQKRMVDAGVDAFTPAKTSYRRSQSTEQAAHSTEIASFHPLAVTRGLRHRFTAISH